MLRPRFPLHALLAPAALAVIGAGGCTKTVTLDLAVVEPCNQTSQALNGASNFSVATAGALSDGTDGSEVTFGVGDTAPPLDVPLGEVVVTVKAFADEITATAVPQAVGRTMPLTISEVSGDQRVLVNVGRVDSFGRTTNADGACTEMTADAPIKGRHGHTATFVPVLNQVLIVGGAIMNPDGTESFLDTAELWDPATGEFEQIEGAGARAYHGASALPDGRVFVSGGFGVVSGQVVTLTSAEIFDPVSRVFTTLGLKQARAHHTSTVMEGPGLLVLVGGCESTSAASSCNPRQAGEGNNGVSTDLPGGTVETFDIASGVTTVALAPAAGLRTGRAFHTATSLENGPQTLLVVAGGANATGAVCDVELFRANGADLARIDPGNIPVSFPANQCPARHAAVAVVASGQPKALFIGGQTVATQGTPSGPGQADIFEFTTVAGVAPFAVLNNARAGHAAATLNDNSVVIVGGSTGAGSIAEILRPEPGTGIVRSTSLTVGPAQARENGALAVLPTNQVLYTGGHTIAAPVTTVATAELFFGP